VREFVKRFENWYSYNMKLKFFSVLFLLAFSAIFLLTNPGKVYAAGISVTGKAKILNTNNSYLDFTNYNSNVTVDDGSGNFSGYAFLEDMGWVAFGTTDNSLGPVNLNLTTGAVTGKAKVLNTGAYLDFTNYNSNVTVALATGVFSGYVFSEDMGWIDFSDTGVSSSSPFLSTAPSGLSGTADSTTAITYSWTDNSSNETGFRVDDSSNNDKSGNLAAGTTSWQETGLSANTSYTRHVHAFNTAGDSAASSNATAVTQSSAPTSANVTGNKSTSTWYNTSSFIFTNGISGGFGGGIEYFRYVWDNSSTHTWTGSETQWTSGTLTKTATADSNSWYLHLQGYNSADAANGTVDLGPYYYDATAPVSFDLDSPGHESYTNSERPSFKWKATTDATSGLSKYSVEIDNGDSGDFSIDDIPTSRTTDYETNKYVAHYENFSDSDSTNNYISVYTKSTSDWGSDNNDGKLKEGKRSWKVKARDNAGNTTDSSRNLYVDYTNPALSSVSIENIGIKDGYLVTTTTKPVITGVITDNLMPDKITLSFYKQSFFLGIETSSELVLSETNALINSSSATSLNFSLTPSQDLDYGKYKLIVKGIDKAGNNSTEDTIKMQIMTDAQAKTLLTKLSKEDVKKIREKSKISLPELEKKAILRREKEAAEFDKIAQNFGDSLSFISRFGGDSLAFAWNALKTSTSVIVDIYDKTRSLAGNIGNALASAFGNTTSGITGATNVIARGMNSMIYSIGGAYQYTAKTTPGVIGNTLLAVGSFNQSTGKVVNQSQENVKNQINKAQQDTIENLKATASIIGNSSSVILNSFQDLNNNLTLSQDSAKKQIAKTHQGSSDVIRKSGKALSSTYQAMVKPVNETGGFLNRLRVGVDTFSAIIFDPNPTYISDVTIEELGRDYAIVSWKTNHYAWGKVNYGTSTSYGEEVILTEREKIHKARLTKLNPGEKYYFEVMSQNKNYVYDAYYTFETKK